MDIRNMTIFSDLVKRYQASTAAQSQVQPRGITEGRGTRCEWFTIAITGISKRSTPSPGRHPLRVVYQYHG